MDKAHRESFVEQVKDALNNAVGLPPGKFDDGEPKPSPTDSPRGTLTSDDAENLPPHGDTGFKPRES